MPAGHRSKARTRFEHAQRRALRNGAMNLDGSYALEDVSVACVRDARSDLSAPPREVGGVVPLIFGFYSKLQMPGAQLAQRGVTYEEIKNCNDRISFFELLTLCRDFGMIPGVVSKQNLQFVWTVCLAEHNRSKKREHFRHAWCGQLRDAGVDIEEFLAVLARIALIAYAETTMGDPKLAVRKLASFLQLSNLKYAKWILRTKGKATQARLYYRSSDEQGRETSRALIEEGKAVLRQKRERRKAAAMKSNHDDDDDDFFTDSQLDRLESQPKWADVMGTAQSNTMTLAQRVMLAQFDKSLILSLKEFCSKSTKRYWLRFDTFGFDFNAALHKGKRYRIRLEVINKSKVMLVVTKLKKVGNILDSISAKFDPKPFASGLSKHIYLTITPQMSPDLECGGILQITLSSAEGGGQPCLLEVPIYYTILPERCKSKNQEENSDESSTDSDDE